MSIFPSSPSVGDEYSGYRWDGTAWTVIGLDLNVDYAPLSSFESHTSASTTVHSISDTGDVVYDNDARLTDSRTPTSHASSHASGGSDAITIAQSQVTDLSTALAAKADASAVPILQVVAASYSTQFLTTSASPVDMGLTATITPTSATSKVLVTICVQYLGQNTDLLRGLLVRGSTTIVGPSRICNSAGVGCWALSYLDSPSTTSATTYKVQVNKEVAGGSAPAFQWADQQTSTITLKEVAA